MEGLSNTEKPFFGTSRPMDRRCGHALAGDCPAQRKVQVDAVIAAQYWYRRAGQLLEIGLIVFCAGHHKAGSGNLQAEKIRLLQVDVLGVCTEAVAHTGEPRHEKCHGSWIVAEMGVHMRHMGVRQTFLHQIGGLYKPFERSAALVYTAAYGTTERLPVCPGRRHHRRMLVRTKALQNGQK